MNNYERFFSEMDTPEPPAGLAQAIVARIARRERRLFIMKTAAAACAFAGSLAVVWIGFADFRTALGETGFLQLASLMFSDFSMTVTNLPDFALSMLESFPVFSAAATLAGVGLAVWSAASMIDDLSAMEHRHIFATR